MSQQQPDMVNRDAVLALVNEMHEATLEISAITPQYREIILAAADSLEALAERIKLL